MSGNWETVGKPKKSKTSVTSAAKTDKPLRMEDIRMFCFVFSYMPAHQIHSQQNLHTHLLDTFLFIFVRSSQESNSKSFEWNEENEQHQ